MTAASAGPTGATDPTAPMVDPAWRGPIPRPGATYEPADYVIAPRVLADGRTLWAMVTLFGARLCVSTHPLDPGYEDYWCYNRSPRPLAYALVARAILDWSDEREPEGWTKHPATDRYRPDGDARREHSSNEIEPR